MNVKKDVLKPVLITFAVLIILCGLIFLIMHFCFPFAMGQLCYKLGNNNAALTYFENDYKKSKNYDELYTMLNLSIKLNNDEKVVLYFNEFSANENYESFILKVDENNNKINSSNLIKSKLYSEDNYLKNRYVLSLCKTNQKETAFSYATINTSFVVDQNKLSPYLFTYIVNNTYFYNDEKFNDVANNMCNYFNALYNSFVSNYVNPEKLVYNFVVGNRLNEVGNNIKELNKLNFNLSISTEKVNNTILEVNQKMALLEK